MSINIKADFTCDNSYAIWLGNANSVHTLIKQETNTLASGIANGEHFTFPASKLDYLYVIAWSDDAVKQGLLGTFNGGLLKQMGDPEWEVLPTNQDKDNNQFPTLVEINSHVTPSLPNDWKKPFVGPSNANTSSIYSGWSSITGIDLAANWVWYDSNNSGNPFSGHNHNEFLVFRIPVKHLYDCCGPCEDGSEKQENILKKEAVKKVFTINGKENNNKRCKEPYSKETCSQLDIPNLEPCFYLHWGDSKKDQMETHDDEVLYLTACNPYGNLSFNGLKIIDIKITPTSTVLPNGEPDMQIIPNKLICFDNLNGCSCASRALTLLNRGAKAQDYLIELNYCIDEITINQYNTGSTNFKINLVNS